MSSLVLYTFEDADGHEWGSFSTDDAGEAQRYAQRTRTRVIANTYEWADSELVWDFTEGQS